ncbi:UNVERIFIED_CONTAM: hypothetical protein FKN15_015950 [Acipenser sinensis]
MKFQVTHNTHLLQRVVDSGVGGEAELQLPDCVQLPLDTMAAVDHLEEKLQDEALVKSLRVVDSGVGGEAELQLPDCVQLPLDTMAAVDHLEEKLQDEALVKSLTCNALSSLRCTAGSRGAAGTHGQLYQNKEPLGKLEEKLGFKAPVMRSDSQHCSGRGPYLYTCLF